MTPLLLPHGTKLPDSLQWRIISDDGKFISVLPSDLNQSVAETDAIALQSELFRSEDESSGNTAQLSGKTAQLPSNLSGAKPRYGFKNRLFELRFEREQELALYIVGSKKKSKREKEYLAWLLSIVPDIRTTDIKVTAQRLRDYLREEAKTAKGDVLTVPADWEKTLDEDAAIVKSFAADFAVEDRAIAAPVRKSRNALSVMDGEQSVRFFVAVKSSEVASICKARQLSDKSVALASTPAGARKLVAKYAPDQPRDKDGKWTDGGAQSSDSRKTSVGNRQIHTPEFKAWFSGSKVVSPDGSPMVVYHGTSPTGWDWKDGGVSFKDEDFSEFKGVTYFASNPNYASGFAQAQANERALGNSARVVPAFLAIRNPYDARADNGYWKTLRSNTISEVKRLIAEGHDGIVLNEVDRGDAKNSGDVFVSFYPTQIKSAIGNNGAFDPRERDITKSVTHDNVVVVEVVLKRSEIGQPLDNLSVNQGRFYSIHKTADGDVVKVHEVGKDALLRLSAITIRPFAGKVMGEIDISADRLAEDLAKAADWDESKHSRDSKGQFAHGESAPVSVLGIVGAYGDVESVPYTEENQGIHSRAFSGKNGTRWRVGSGNSINWSTEPSQDDMTAVENYLIKRGHDVRFHTVGWPGTEVVSATLSKARTFDAGSLKASEMAATNLPRLSDEELVAKYADDQPRDERGRWTDSGGGMVAYHGTPHLVPEFSTQHIGSGEGAQSYGYGLYFAENPATAESYRQALAGEKAIYRVDGKMVEDVKMLPAYDGLAVRAWAKPDYYKPEEMAERLAEQSREFDDTDEKVERVRSEMQAALDKYKGRVTYEEIAEGNVYQVRIDVKPEELLDWEKQLKDQSPQVQAAVKSLWKFDPKITGEGIYQIASQLRYLRNPRWNTPEKVGATFGPASVEQKNGSAELLKVGIVGMRYLDQGSRTGASVYDAQQALDAAEKSGDKASIKAAKQKLEDAWKLPDKKTYNLVIFDDSRIHITHVNGKNLTKDESIAKTREWREELHPRGERGRFTEADGVDGEPKEVVWHRERVEVAMTTMRDAIDGWWGDKTESERNNGKADARKLFDNMSAEAVRRWNKNVKAVAMHGSIESLNNVINDIAGEKSSGSCAGAWVANRGDVKGNLHLDGGVNGIAAIEFWAHEFAHAIDGEPTWTETVNDGIMHYGGGRLSDSYDWHEAWQSEINKPDCPLNAYAKKNQREGFAEYGRMLWMIPKEAREFFPKCYAVWKKAKLV